MRAKLGSTSQFSLYPAPVTNCRCAATIPCDGTICGGRRFGEAGGGESNVLVCTPLLTRRLSALLRVHTADDESGVPIIAACSNAAAAAAAAMEANEDADNECVAHATSLALSGLSHSSIHAPRVDTRNSGYAEAVVTVDNYTSKAHTVIQVRTRDRKGLFYDSMRATKDLKVNVSYGKVCHRVCGAACPCLRLTSCPRRWRSASRASASWTCLSHARGTRRWSAAFVRGAHAWSVLGNT